MKTSILEHIRTQAITVAQYLQSESAGSGLIKNALKENPELIDENLKWFDSMMRGYTKEQIAKWQAQGYNILQSGVPHKTFGDLWEYLDRLDEEDDDVIVLEEAATWTDVQLAGFWDRQRAAKNSPPEHS